MLKSTKFVLALSPRTPSKRLCFTSKPEAICCSIELRVMKLKMVSLLLFWPSLSMRPMRWFFFAGFHGSSKLIRVSATCRFKPDPPASVDRNILYCGLDSNLRIRSPLAETGIFPFSSTKPMLFSRSSFPISLCTFIHSEKIIIFVALFGTSNSSNKICLSSSSLGDSLVWSSIK